MLCTGSIKFIDSRSVVYGAQEMMWNDSKVQLYFFSPGNPRVSRAKKNPVKIPLQLGFGKLALKFCLP